VWDFIWNDMMINPMINGLIIMSRILFDNFGLAIIVFTCLVRLATLPLTLRQLHSSRRMQALQPKVQELQKKYKDPKRRQEEMMKLYRTEGVNPIGCLGPMLIQMPIWFALYAVLTRTVGGTPERTVELAQRLYPWDFIQTAVPLGTQFMWLDLGRPDMIMVVLVGVTTWLQTKLSLTQTTMSSPQAAQTQGMMLWMMPIMFAWFTISVPSGLAVYWTATNIIGIVMNYFVYGWNDRPWTDIFSPSNSQGGPQKPRPAGSAALSDRPKRESPVSETDGDDERQSDAQSGNKRKERRRGGGQSAPAARSRPVSGRRRGR
jgi:YidC/Oxa1 family membrane protein insertase